ncbi:MAG: hypothetical protein JRJ00_06710 [Deltaproteobacteria bacterium]|nr:hypothetical protein [Deltaproteobacteria bacterium]
MNRKSRLALHTVACKECGQYIHFIKMKGVLRKQDAFAILTKQPLDSQCIEEILLVTGKWCRRVTDFFWKAKNVK